MIHDISRELCGETARLADEIIEHHEYTLLSFPPDVAGEGERLTQLERIIRRCLQTYREIGPALEEIRENRLYRRLGYRTFEQYCLGRWGWKSPQVAYNYIAAAKVAENLQTTGQQPSLSQAVELGVLPPEHQLEVVETLGSKGKALDAVTVREVRTVVKEIKSRAATIDETALSTLAVAPIMLVSKPGYLWILGDNMLFVGDATRPDDVARLIAPGSADLVIIDPPYNVQYKGRTEEHLTMLNDSLPVEKYKKLLEDAFRSCRTIVKPTASLYVFHPSFWQREFQNALEKVGFAIRNQIIWAKNAPGWGFGRYKFQHEPIFYCHVTGETDGWYGDQTQSTVWEVNKPRANKDHPTMKPLELIEQALLNSSKKGDTVVDLFGGSGSTLIACENNGRTARLIEIDPKYADRIVRRWQNRTNRNAVLDGDGRTFNEITAAHVSLAA